MDAMPPKRATSSPRPPKVKASQMVFPFLLADLEPQASPERLRREYLEKLSAPPVEKEEE